MRALMVQLLCGATIVPAQDTLGTRTAFRFSRCVQYEAVAPKPFGVAGSETWMADVYLNDSADAFAIRQRCISGRCGSKRASGIWDLRSRELFRFSGKDTYAYSLFVREPMPWVQERLAVVATATAGTVEARSLPDELRKDSIVVVIDTAVAFDPLCALRIAEDDHWMQRMFVRMPAKGLVQHMYWRHRDGDRMFVHTLRLVEVRAVDTTFTYTDRTLQSPPPSRPPMPPDVVAPSYRFHHAIDYVIEQRSEGMTKTTHERVFLADSLVGCGICAPLSEDRIGSEMPEGLRDGSLFLLYDSLAQSNYLLIDSWMGSHHTRLNKAWPVSGKPPGIHYTATGRTKTIQGIPTAEFVSVQPAYTNHTWVSRKHYPAVARGMRQWGEHARHLMRRATGLPPGLLLEGHTKDLHGRITDWRATRIELGRDTSFTTAGYLEVETFHGNWEDGRPIGRIFNRPPEALYSFSHTALITTSEGPNTTERRRVHANTEGYTLAEHIGVRDSLPDGLRLCVHVLDRKLTYTCAEENGKRTARASIPIPLYDRSGDEDMDFRQTGRTDTIAGLIAREWKAMRYDPDEDRPDGHMVLWIAEGGPAPLRMGMLLWAARYWGTWLVADQVPPGVIVGGYVLDRGERVRDEFRVDALLPDTPGSVSTAGYAMKVR